MYTEGQHARDVGAANVADSNLLFTAEARKLAIRLRPAISNGKTTGEVVRQALETHGLIPNHPNAWGSLVLWLRRKGYLIPTGEYVQPMDKTSHARAIQVYTWKDVE